MRMRDIHTINIHKIVRLQKRRKKCKAEWKGKKRKHTQQMIEKGRI